MVLKLYWVHIKYSEHLKRTFLIFAQFKSWRSDEVQIVFKERETELSRPLFIWRILENGLEANFRSYSVSRAFQNRIFYFFCKFSVTKWGKFKKWGKNSKLFKLDSFEATFRSIVNVVNHCKCYFYVFCKFLSNKVESVFR